MKKSKGNTKTIAGYISKAPKDAAKMLRDITAIARKEAPTAKEGISYGMPVFKLNGVLVYYAAYEKHIGFYPMPAAIKAFKKELSKYKTSKGTVQFPIGKPLPLSLIRKIIKFRVRECCK